MSRLGGVSEQLFRVEQHAEFQSVLGQQRYGVVWGNTAPSGFSNFVTFHSMRKNNGTYPESPTPNGWGYCGTSSGLSGAGSNWDQNTDASSGYPCLDQPGRGMGDLLSGAFPECHQYRDRMRGLVTVCLAPSGTRARI